MKVVRGMVLVALAVVVASYLLPVGIGAAMAADWMKYGLNSVEYGDIKEETRQESYWDSIKKGMLAGEKMMLELNQMEMAYPGENDRNVYEGLIGPDDRTNSEGEYDMQQKWSWMRHYRKWEANRKVVLCLEDWIEPELGDDKSDLFQELEDELL